VALWRSGRKLAEWRRGIVAERSGVVAKLWSGGVAE